MGLKPLVEIIGYRDWARDLFSKAEKLASQLEWRFYDFLPHVNRRATVFLVGWSDIVPEDFYKDRNVFVLHPSPLPRYRGGSPIQHQIINGETVSAVTIFKLDAACPEVDSGPIACQMPYSLEGDLSEVLERISVIGAIAITAVVEAIVQDQLVCLPQRTDGFSVMRRRRPAESEITIEELQVLSARTLYNKVRALQDPYPNAFIRTSDGGRLLIKKAQYQCD